MSRYCWLLLVSLMIVIVMEMAMCVVIMMPTVAQVLPAGHAYARLPQAAAVQQKRLKRWPVSHLSVRARFRSE